MTGAVVLGRVKTSQDVTFRDIVVSQDGSGVDLTDGDIAVTAQLRLTPDNPDEIEFTIDSEQLALSRIRLSLPSATTADMIPGVYYGDVRIVVEGLKTFSKTFEVIVEKAVTR